MNKPIENKKDDTEYELSEEDKYYMQEDFNKEKYEDELEARDVSEGIVKWSAQ